MAPQSSSLRSRIAAFENGTISNVDPEEGQTVQKDDSGDFMDVPISPTASSLLGPLLKPTASPNEPSLTLRAESPDRASSSKDSLIDLSEFEEPLRGPPQLPTRPSSSSSKAPTNASSRDSSSSFDVSRFSADMGSGRSADSHTTTSSSSMMTSPPTLPRKPAHLQGSPLPAAIPIAMNGSKNRVSPPVNDGDDGVSSSWYKVPQMSSTQFLDVQAALNAAPRRGHGQSLSTSSFQSVSLSSDGDAAEPDDGPATPSVAATIAAFNQRNIEPVATPPKTLSGPLPVETHNLPYVPRKSPRNRDSASSIASTVLVKSPTGGSIPPSPIKTAPPPLPARKPALPARPSGGPPSVGSSSSISSFSIRRVAPPANSNSFAPPPTTRSSTSNSGISVADTASSAVSRNSSVSAASSVERRKAPVPPAARRRFENLFDVNVVNRRGASLRSPPPPMSATGAWRGADSLDDDDYVSADVPPRLSGALVKSIWECSKLPKGTLRRIWMEVDTKKTGSLEREPFVQGMWLIDAELAKAARQRPLAARVR